MKTIKFFLLTVAVLSMSFIVPDTRLTSAERKYAVDLLQENKDKILQKVNGLTAEQLNFKADANSWSIAECLEHIATSETKIFAQSQASLKEPADPSKRSEVKVTDIDIVKMVSDRSTKRKAEPELVPNGKFGSFDGIVREFKTARDNNIYYLKTTTDDLRNHYNDFPFGKIDAYQTILLMTAHSIRHTAQIDEVMKNPNFPKKNP
ncbi:DinB family protein [Chryseolinea lacunae]|uniref:DinB family protein n=1 Tax=Chryseolinea lacunae TaxID=2801331 RepID=A0ABS1L0K6_9BACT|nr:DinB family protein [Chryseolinea lacunae]MBL0745226.1 DinB family protein [Chryseolinea lacunae]